MKRFRKILSVLDFVLILACAFRVFAIYNDYTRHTELYTTYSAPWYSSIITTVILTAVMVLIVHIVYFVVGYIIKKRKQEQTN